MKYFDSPLLSVSHEVSSQHYKWVSECLLRTLTARIHVENTWQRSVGHVESVCSGLMKDVSLSRCCMCCHLTCFINSLSLYLSLSLSLSHTHTHTHTHTNTFPGSVKHVDWGVKISSNCLWNENVCVTNHFYTMTLLICQLSNMQQVQ